MTTFWIFIALVVIVSLLMIWVPHFRQQKQRIAEEAGVRKQTNLELFNERLAILKQELVDDLLDQQEFDALKQELEISLLQDMKQEGDDSLNAEDKPKSILWPIVMTIAVLGLSGYFYQHLGAYKEIANPPQAQHSPHEGMTQEQVMSQRLQMMEAEVKAEPENSQAWFALGHAYISSSQYNHAIAAFDKTMELVGVHAELLGPKATAMYYAANQKITPKVQAVIDQSLKLDPQDPSTLLLIGMNAFFTAQYQNAIDAWQMILDSDRQDVDRTALMNAIQSAKMSLQSETGAMPNDDAHNPLKHSDSAVKSTIDVTIKVSPELTANVDSKDMIFVFARSTTGPKVPLAATKVSASELPVTVTLDDTTSMGGDVKLSSVSEVEIIAVLSKHGNVKAQAGDLKGIIDAVKVGQDTELTLNTVVQ
ncbi:c-type cytochrome biogenesis protein CcmI [Shewanella intestini]|uniref:C-type cytochrome biogenesis protein CcmI n=1 Tax=Shewanella intestini TaxID=2017544 RepID=A0ABS5I5Q4_9GAMM|nr:MULTISPECIES: c-type cytochrome biogenesis protein CcmI [Shewanella]MBR9728710.1 c-type cytochrome biogenesis protein CcmI [Shewanella intestini]MRG37633.1 c-type cytochrome biogenesis protein CcmI [Shewanella sp. XMDDZSB0408]